MQNNAGYVMLGRLVAEDFIVNFDDLITMLPPPPNRAKKSGGENEHHLYEGAVMVAYAMHLLRTEPTNEVSIHPDGEHGKQFNFYDWLRRRGFSMQSRTGTTAYGGIYRDNTGKTIVVHPRSGLGDVVAKVGDIIVSAECKGGIINSRNAGPISRLDKGLCEVVGRLMASPSLGRQVAVVPYTAQTLRLATRLRSRCMEVGIELALVKSRGEIVDVGEEIQ